MNYGGNNDVNNNTCPRCGKSCDTHRPFAFISSDQKTEELVRKLQGNLDEVITRALVKGFDKSRETCMVGSAIATINSRVYQYVTISGAKTELLTQMKQNLGKDVRVITSASGLPLKTIQGKTLEPQPIRQNRNRDYPLGSCAAQKLLMSVFNQAQSSGGADKLTKLSMAELLWCDSTTGEGHNRDWSTGEIVCSCDTCKQVIPMMLCSAEL
ncbi:hypothetical protein [Scytonema sp. NUACC26]|uniref:hypothetical protein n=1 Tax=Scytonema sp. NUACC26 TaxID=3140176 RepID=UPI0034DBD5FB